MSQADAATLAYWGEHREQLRQSENQRAVLTNYLLAITAALSGLIAQQKFAVTTLPLSILITLSGLFGALATAKYHERAEYHLQQARALTQVLKRTAYWRAVTILLGNTEKLTTASTLACIEYAYIACGPDFIAE